MSTVEMLVGLKIPDGTALSAKQALREMGFAELGGLARYAYYSFDIEGDAGQFREKISDADILVNANKHTVSFEVPTEGINVLVQDKEKPIGLMNTLRERLGMKEIRGMDAGTLWVLSIEGNARKESARKMAEELLANVHYQRYMVM
ncbi:TPA: hypothetical protein HA372_01045 [Candidatus Woesearchaeota archaeon]|nr:hypothetical protein [Candidatus Woesearchaeota archaeon]HIJ18257.1 hypothetical protein [Candidatus Woesearchaeota archaeon]